MCMIIFHKAASTQGLQIHIFPPIFFPKRVVSDLGLWILLPVGRDHVADT